MPLFVIFYVVKAQLLQICILNYHLIFQRFEISIKKLAAVNDTLEKLGTPKMYKELHIKLKYMIIGWIVYSLTMNFFDTIWWLSIEEIAPWGLYFAHAVNHCIHVNTFVDMLFTFFLWFVQCSKILYVHIYEYQYAHTHTYILYSHLCSSIFIDLIVQLQ